MRARNIVVNTIGVSVAFGFAGALFGYGVASWQEAVGWLIGMFGFVWCTYTDIKVKLAPDRYLNLLLIAPLITATLYLATSENLLSGCVRGLFHLEATAMAAGAIWIFRMVFSAIFQKEALGEADIFPCAMVGGLTGSGFAGILLFFLTPFIMLPIICWYCCRGKSPTLPLLPALFIATLIIIPLNAWIQQNISLLN